MAENQGILTKATLSISEEPGIDYSDLGIVLGNLLENAVEACARQKDGEKFIHVEAKEENKCLMLQINNSFDGKAKSRDGVFLSSKRNGEAGIGIRSVTAIAKKYNGLARFTCEGNIFRTSILLYTKDPKSPPLSSEPESTNVT